MTNYTTYNNIYHQLNGDLIQQIFAHLKNVIIYITVVMLMLEEKNTLLVMLFVCVSLPVYVLLSFKYDIKSLKSL